MALDKLVLLSGIDIPFHEGHLIIHQPTLEEVAFIGEESFYIGCQTLTFCKNFADTSDKNDLEALSNFEIFMMVMKQKDTKIKKFQNYVKMVLTILFPLYHFSLDEDQITFFWLENEERQGFLNKENYDDFCKILIQLCCLNGIVNTEEEYNPAGAAAKKIADKLKQRHQKLAELKAEKEELKDISILAKFQSILSIGLNIPMTTFKSYTVFQLFDNYSRYMLKVEYDTYMRARMAGADIKEQPDDWMKDLYDNKK